MASLFEYGQGRGRRPDEEGIKTFHSHHLHRNTVGGAEDLMKKGLRPELVHVTAFNHSGGAEDLMKKGLRRDRGPHLVFYLWRGRRPDEEGIKTVFAGRVENPCFGGAEDLMKKGLRQESLPMPRHIWAGQKT